MSKRRSKKPRTIEAQVRLDAWATVTVEVPANATDEEIEEEIWNAAHDLEQSAWNVSVEGDMLIDEWDDK